MSQSSTSERSVQQKSIRHTKQQLCEALEALAQRRDAADARAAELLAQLQEVKAKLAKAEQDVAILKTDAEALAAVRPCAPGGQPAVEALMPQGEGVAHVWFMLAKDCFKIAWGGQSAAGKSWTFIKFADGTQRTVTEKDGGTLECTCIHHAERGQSAKPCRHKRLIKMAKALFGTCGPKFTTAPAGAGQTEQAPAKRLTMAQVLEDHDDCFVGVRPAA